MEMNEGKKSGKKSTKGKYRAELSGDYHFDYRDPVSLVRFISDGGKITPARILKLSIAQQKKVALAVKKARNLGLLPVGSHAHDVFVRSEVINASNFEV